MWQFRCLSVKTANWWPSALVLIPTGLIQSIDWQSQIVNLRIDQALVRASPVCEPEGTVDGAFVETMLTYYGISWVKK